jgi:hypothetical protein
MLFQKASMIKGRCCRLFFLLGISFHFLLIFCPGTFGNFSSCNEITDKVIQARFAPLFLVHKRLEKEQSKSVRRNSSSSFASSLLRADTIIFRLLSPLIILFFRFEQKR